MLEKYIVYESASILGYCTFWVAGKWFACFVDFGEVVSYVHDTTASTYITWLDYIGLVLFEDLQSFVFLQC